MTNNTNTTAANRFLTPFSQSQPPNPNANDTSAIGDEFEENDVLWTPSIDSESYGREASPVKPQSSIRFGGGADASGIRAVLPGGEDRSFSDSSRLLCRKISLPSSSSLSVSSSKTIPAAPKRQSSVDREMFMSAPAGAGFYVAHSLPVNIPAREKAKGGEVVADELSGYDYKEFLPPHEIVARASGQSEMTFSVLEGVGRTLKGRDLRQVRNAIWRQTGFLD